MLGHFRTLSTSCRCLAKTEVDSVKLHWQKFGNGAHVALCLPGLVGYGRSRPPNRNAFTEDFVLRVDAHLAAKLMETLGYEKYSLIGWSNGGITGALIAAEFPERVNKLVMCNSPSGCEEHGRKVMQVMVDLDYWSVSQRKALLRDYEKPYVEGMLQDWKKLGDTQGVLIKQWVGKLMHCVKAPTLYIRGEKDVVVAKSDIKDWAGWISNFKVHSVPKGAHDHLEFLDEFVEATQNFLLAD